jgi:hypothetical protein
VRPDDFRRALLDHEPEIVHFSGHGGSEDGLALENAVGQLQLVSTESLVRLFGLFKDKIECVLLNACYSEAQAIHKHVGCVIGMNQEIGVNLRLNYQNRTIRFFNNLTANRTFDNSCHTC